MSTVPDSVEVDVGDVPQWDSRTQSRSGLPLRVGGMYGRCGLWYLCGTRAGLCVPEW